MSEKSIAKARAAVTLFNKEKRDWEYSGGSEGISTVHIYHHPVNNTYRIVGRLEKDLSVVINFALVKGLSYKRETPTFHQCTDQSQLYGLNFVSKQDAQVFGNGVFTSLENLKTIERVPPQPQPRIQKLLQQYNGKSYGSNLGREPDEISSHHRDQPQSDAYDKYSPGEAPERNYSVNQNEMQRERQRPGESAVPSSTLSGPDTVKQSETRPSEMIKDEAHSSSASEEGITNMAYLNKGDGKEENEEGKGKGQEARVPPKPKPKPKPKPSIGKNHRDQPHFDAIDKHSPGEESAVTSSTLSGPDTVKQSEISKGGTGLAFSGGGIRSAAFCSGVLRSLLKSGVEVDYLSCVSGGGFTGTAYLDWKCHEKKKDDTREGEGKGGWHETFFNHMKDRSGYICDWTDIGKGPCDTLVFFTLMALVLVVLPVIKWGTYAFPVAVMIDLFGIGNLMRKSADCDAALERQREINSSAVPGKDLIDRCLSGNHKRDITILFSSLFAGFVVLYVVISKLKKEFLKYPCLKSVLLLFEYAAACVLIFTFIPFTIYDFFVKIALWQQVLVGIIAVIVWVAIPFLRRKTSYVLIVYAYSFVIYWRVFRVDVPVFFFKHEDHVSHWLLFFSGVALMISFVTTNLKEELVHCYFRRRVQKAFFHEKDSTKPLTLADLEGTKPEYISNIVVNRWKNNEKDKTNYTLLTMSPSGIERFDQCGKGQFEGKLEPKDIMLSEAMATSAAALSSHMGKYEESVEGLTRLHTILGLDMGATMISDEGYRKKCPRLFVTFILDFVRGFLLIIPTICYRHGSKRYEPALLGCMITFLVIHALLAFIAVLDLACEEAVPHSEEQKPKGCDWFVRWLTVHIPFVYNVRLLFSKDNSGSIPPAVLLLSDGGHYENLAILPLLQRKLKKIVVVDGGYKENEEDYGKSILDALMLARTKLNCSFYVEDGKDLISDLMRTFVNPSKRIKSRYYKFKVHYDEENDSEPERDGEIILLVPRKPEDIRSKEEKEELTCCCCECCHCKSCLCACLSKCLCNAFPQHSTANQFFTPRMFQAYHEEGSRACEDAKADVFLQTVSSVVEVRDRSTEEPNTVASQPLRGDSCSVDETTQLLGDHD